MRSPSVSLASVGPNFLCNHSSCEHVPAGYRTAAATCTTTLTRPGRGACATPQDKGQGQRRPCHRGRYNALLCFACLLTCLLPKRNHSATAVSLSPSGPSAARMCLLACALSPSGIFCYCTVLPHPALSRALPRPPSYHARLARQMLSKAHVIGEYSPPQLARSSRCD